MRQPHLILQILRQPDGNKMENILYTFNFYDPWDFVTSDGGVNHTYPARYDCGTAFRGWVSTFCPGGPDQSMLVDKRWLQALLLRNPPLPVSSQLALGSSSQAVAAG